MPRKTPIDYNVKAVKVGKYSRESNIISTMLGMGKLFWGYRHLNRILISREALRYNHNLLSSINPQIKIGQVLKSNAYGHGLRIVAPEFDKLNLPFLFVDSLYEAYELYKIRIKTPILILGYTHPRNYQVKRLPFTFTVSDWETAEALNRFQPGCKVHLFVDTGMSREGILLKDLRSFLKKFKTLTSLKIDGLASHLANTDALELDNFTRCQVNQFDLAYKIIIDEGYHPNWRHLAASPGLRKTKTPVVNLARVGLMGFGIEPQSCNKLINSSLNLKPVLRFISTVAQIKTIPSGSKIGYDGTYTVNKPMTIGVIPAGYYEGIDRRLSNRGVVKIRGIECPIIGRVSMNITTVDVSPVKGIGINDEVEIISNDPSAPNSLVNLSTLADLIPYETLIHLAESTRREVVDTFC